MATAVLPDLALLASAPPTTRLVLRGRPVQGLSDDRCFYQFCARYPDLALERTARGNLVVMPPARPDTSHGNADLTAQFFAWAQRDGTGLVFGPDAGFTLPNRAVRAPDVSWVRRERWRGLPPAVLRSFPRICPDFVLELRSRSDRLAPLHAKMREYRDNGARLGWLINPPRQQVFVYRAGEDHPAILTAPVTVSGEDVLPGFVLDLPRLWRALEFR